MNPRPNFGNYFRYLTLEPGENHSNIKNSNPSADAMTPAPTILATCKQTRFHLLDDNPSQEVWVVTTMIQMTINVQICSVDRLMWMD